MNLLEVPGLTPHCDTGVAVFRFLWRTSSERFGELCSSVRVFCCLGRPFHLAFFADELRWQRCACFVSFPLFESAITHPSALARCVFGDCEVVHGPGRLIRQSEWAAVWSTRNSGFEYAEEHRFIILLTTAFRSGWGPAQLPAQRVEGSVYLG